VAYRTAPGSGTNEEGAANEAAGGVGAASCDTGVFPVDWMARQHDSHYARNVAGLRGGRTSRAPEIQLEKRITVPLGLFVVKRG
jgi:hypothetical protein